jgi:hypothetical protein
VLSIGSLPPSPASQEATASPETAASEAVESAVAELAPFESSSGSHSVSRAYRTRRGTRTYANVMKRTVRLMASKSQLANGLTGVFGPQRELAPGPNLATADVS